MAEQKTLKQPKLFDKIDAKVEGREGLKTVWQAGKFSLFSVVAMLIQTTLQLILPCHAHPDDAAADPAVPL